LFLQFENADWEKELSDFYNSDVDVPAMLTVDGRAYRDVGVRFRGMSSYAFVPEGSKRSLNVSIDFAKNAESLGARTWKAKTPEQLRQALQEARSEKRSCVIVVETEKHRFLPGSGVWWDVAVAEVSQDPVTQKLRSEYEKNRQRLQRFHY